MIRSMLAILIAAVVASSIGSLNRAQSSGLELPSGARRALTAHDGPFFQRVGCPTGQTKIESALGQTYETVQLDRFVCVGESLESYTCQQGHWTLTQVDCPAGMAKVAAAPAQPLTTLN